MQRTSKTLIVLIIYLLVAGTSDVVLNAANRWALLVGISHYPQGEYPSAEDWGEIHGTNDVAILTGMS